MPATDQPRLVRHQPYPLALECGKTCLNEGLCAGRNAGWRIFHISGHITGHGIQAAEKQQETAGGKPATLHCNTGNEHKNLPECSCHKCSEGTARVCPEDGRELFNIERGLTGRCPNVPLSTRATCHERAGCEPDIAAGFPGQNCPQGDAFPE